MPSLTYATLELIGAALPGDTAQAIGARFHAALAPYGIRATYTRAYAHHDAPEQVFARVSPPGWEAFYRDERLGAVNYLPREVRRATGPFRWSDIRLTDPRELALSRTLAAHGFPDGLAAPFHGARGYVAVASLAFERLDQVSPDERAAIALAAGVLHERMKSLSLERRAQAPGLSARERDCLAFIAEGKTSWEVSRILGVAETTVITHVKNARLKLGVGNRTQAVAKAVALGLLWPAPPTDGTP